MSYFRVISLLAIALTLYGGCCVFIVLISQLLGSLVADLGLHLDLCSWMVVVAVGLTPLTWLGTPKVQTSFVNMCTLIINIA